MHQKGLLNWNMNSINDNDFNNRAVNIGDFCSNTYNNFKNIYIYSTSKDHSFMVQDNAQGKDMG